MMLQPRAYHSSLTGGGHPDSLKPPQGIELNNILKDFKSIHTREYGSTSNIPEFLEIGTEKPSYWNLFYRQLFPGNQKRDTMLKKMYVISFGT